MSTCASTANALLIVTLLFRSRPEFEQLSHVVDATSVYLDSSVKLDVAKACKFNSVGLLERIWRQHNVQQIETDQREFQRAISTAIPLQGTELLSWLLDHFRDCFIPSQIVQHAAAQGKWKVLHLFKDKCASWTDTSEFVDGSMSPDVVNLFFQQELDHSRDGSLGMDDLLDFLCCENVERGEIVQRLGLAMKEASKPCVKVEWNSNDIVCAAQNQQIATVKWLYNHSPAYHDIDNTIRAAAGNQDVALVEWLRARYQYGA
ncbi:hypothetical protein PHMEG_00029514 [Phytophthora megakarya]|uniref:Uncharacterized protein n=1 Tax=Phytophthora megakarya TaxID=4795 RepID=A0A225V3F8_9STRA|nr:hypothetical protein PHMEG_00029514 [Phytophthora megakarya]